jgi:hypothetical protein
MRKVFPTAKMADENWQKVRRIFKVALQKDPQARRSYILDACGDDKILLAEVESLVSSFEALNSFMETPGIEIIIGRPEVERKKLERGQCFAHYEIIGQIGTGGMGEVYLAEDKKLDRKVAIKILNQKFARLESNLDRFFREARTASALNHPNILTIH